MSRRASYPAEFYLALHHGTPGDVAFYQRQCRSASSILELGCGDGRLLQRLARPGRTLYGIDNQRAFLALARERRTLQGNGAELHLGDMTRFNVSQRFDRILVPFSGFFCLSPLKKKECLRAARKHLKRDGLLILDVYNTEHLRFASNDNAAEPLLDDFDWVGRVFVAAQRRDNVAPLTTAKPYDVYERHAWYPSRQRIDVSYRYCPEAKRRVSTAKRVPPLTAGVVEGTIRHWYLHREQLLALLTEHGFAARVSSLQGPLANAEQWAVIAKRQN